MKRLLCLAVFAALSSAQIAAADPPGRPGFPRFGTGTALGYDLSFIDGDTASGLAAEHRFVFVQPRYPAIAGIVALRYSHLFLDGGEHADSYEPALMLGTFVPFDLFFEPPADLPRAAGIPVMVGIKPLAILRTESETLRGYGLVATTGLPLPPSLFLDISYSYARYNGGVDRHSLILSLNVPVALAF